MKELKAHTSAGGSVTAEELTRAIYVGYPENLTIAAIGNTVLVLRKLLDEGAVDSSDPQAPRGFNRASRIGNDRERAAKFRWAEPGSGGARL